MIKPFKKIVNWLLAFFVTLSCFAVFSGHVAAGTDDSLTEITQPPIYTEEEIAIKLARLINLFDGRYFTSDELPAGDVFPSCNVANVVASEWLLDLINEEAYSSFCVSYFPSQYYTSSNGGVYQGGYGGYSCLGFSNFAEYYLYSSCRTDNLVGELIYSGPATVAAIRKYARAGDVIRFGAAAGHSLIFCSVVDDYSIMALDSNWYSDCKVTFGVRMMTTLSRYGTRMMTITRASNYAHTTQEIVSGPSDSGEEGEDIQAGSGSGSSEETEEASWSISGQPENVLIRTGEKAIFSIEVSGEDQFTYQWYYKLKTSDTFSLWGGKTKAGFGYYPADSRNGMQVYCEVTDSSGVTKRSETVTLSIVVPQKQLAITQQPGDLTIYEGEKVSFSVIAEGDELTYQWYFKTVNSKSFILWNGRTKSNVSYLPTENRDGLQVYCVIKDVHGNSIQSRTATLAVLEPKIPLMISQQPQDVTIESGGKVVLSIVASGKELTYQWYFKTKTASQFSLWGGKTQAGFGYYPADSRDGMQVYCVITDAYGDSLTSDVVKLSIILPPKTLEILNQSQDIEILEGQKASFSCVASGDGLSYQWFFKTSTSSKYVMWGGKTKASFCYIPSISRDGLMAYCQVTDQYGNILTTEPVTVSILPN